VQVITVNKKELPRDRKVLRSNPTYALQHLTTTQCWSTNLRKPPCPRSNTTWSTSLSHPSPSRQQFKTI